MSIVDITEVKENEYGVVSYSTGKVAVVIDDTVGLIIINPYHIKDAEQREKHTLKLFVTGEPEKTKSSHIYHAKTANDSIQFRLTVFNPKSKKPMVELEAEGKLIGGTEEEYVEEEWDVEETF